MAQIRQHVKKMENYKDHRKVRPEKINQCHKSFIMDLKEKFKHITGMRPQFTAFNSEEERMASEITS